MAPPSSPPPARAPAQGPLDPLTAALGPLCLEVLDTAFGLAPRGATQLRLVLTGAPPRLEALHSTGHVEPREARPDVGLEAGELRAVLDEALGELARTAAAQGVAWSAEALELHLDEAEPARATVTLCAPEGVETPAARVELPAAALRQRVFTEAFFDFAREHGARAAERQQSFLKSVEGHDDWSYDQPTQRLGLARGVLPWRAYRAVVVGTYARESESFVWGWANRQILPGCTEAVARLCEALGKNPALGVLRRPNLPCERRFAGALAQLVGGALDARGVYAADYGPGELLLAVFEERAPSPDDTLHHDES